MEFYNPDVKIQYIKSELANSPKTTIVNVSGILHSVSVYEHQLDKDIAEFSNDELIKYIINDFCLNRSNSSRKTTLSRLRQYIKWYNQVIRQNGSALVADIFQSRRGHNKSCLEPTIRNEYYLEMWKLRYGLVENTDTDEGAKGNEGEEARKKLFKTEDALFYYIQYIFQNDQDDKYVMYRAIAYLAYYGFDAETIRSLKRADVHKEKHIVQDRIIDNDLAFSAIYDACITGGTSGRKYIDSPYLIRRVAQGRPPKDDMRVPLYAIRIFPKKQFESIEKLGAVKYQGYVIKFLMMQKYRLFFKIYADEQIYGKSVVSNKIINHEYDEYGIKIQSIEYELWKKNAKDP